MSIETEKFNRIREIALKNNVDKSTVFYNSICVECTDYQNDICDSLDNDYCQKYQRFLNGN